jgi:hypothetical protein
LSNQWTKKVLFNFVYLLNLLSWFTDTNKGEKMEINLTLEINKEFSKYKDKDKKFFEELYKNFLEQDRAIVSVKIKEE